MQFLLTALLVLGTLFGFFVWWTGFRRRETLVVREKVREQVDATYWVTANIFQNDVAWHHRLIDEHGHSWNVSRVAYEQAEVGQPMTLRQWVDEWRPESEQVRSLWKFLEAVERYIEQGR
ncbi:MAG TPA: hypothetical protein VD969_06835 [Symbiobacteriaceae bacterium]|nr:hypothetical protein [Symbiobacteriaceae bacterium]